MLSVRERDLDICLEEHVELYGLVLVEIGEMRFRTVDQEPLTDSDAVGSGSAIA